MDRKEFLSLIGMSAGAFVLSRCLQGCSAAPGQAYPSPPTNVNFTLDLWLPTYSPLNSNGGYVYYDGIIVARVSPSTYIAVSQYCTHQGTSVVFQTTNNNEFYCSEKGATFSSSGLVITGPATVALQQYQTQLINTINGNSVRVYS